MNIRMEYLYRDAANYKWWGSVVVAACDAVPSAVEAQDAARAILIDGAHFDAVQADLPDLREADWDDELDHDWHELVGFAETAEEPDDPGGRDVQGLLHSLRAGAADCRWYRIVPSA